MLPTDPQQPDIVDVHIHNLAVLFLRNHAEDTLGIHSAHGHVDVLAGTTLLGFNYDKPYCRWARLIANQRARGHIFVLTDHGFHPYECQTGPLPDLSQIGTAFLLELADYLNTHKLSSVI
jgi:hypothetical protein